MMQLPLWLLMGVLATIPLLGWLHHRCMAQTVRITAMSLIIVALVYPIRTMMLGAIDGMIMELAGLFVFALCAIAGLILSPWLLVIGWLLHPCWDLAVHALGPGASVVPSWYAWACVSFDLVVAVYLGYRIRRGEAS